MRKLSAAYERALLLDRNARTSRLARDLEWCEDSLSLGYFSFFVFEGWNVLRRLKALSSYYLRPS